MQGAAGTNEILVRCSSSQAGYVGQFKDLGERIVLIVVCWGRMAARLARIELASSLQSEGPSTTSVHAGGCVLRL